VHQATDGADAALRLDLRRGALAVTAPAYPR